MKLADLTKDQLIAKLRATKKRHRTTMKHLEQIHRAREARIGELEDREGCGPSRARRRQSPLSTA